MNFLVFGVIGLFGLGLLGVVLVAHLIQDELERRGIDIFEIIDQMYK